MKITFEEKEDILIASLSGELDHHTAAAAREAIDSRLEQPGFRHLVFSFAGVEFMDSAGIGVVMGRYNKVKSLGGKVYVTECGEYVHRILEMAGIFTITSFCETKENAVTLLKQ